MKKKNKNIKISFVGNNANDVTGSCIYIEIPSGEKILLECGLYQSSNIIGAYKINTIPFKFKPSEIDYCFICHAHIDHTGLIPRLFKEGFKGKIISTYETYILSRPLLLNSAFIISKESILLSKIKKKQIKPIYESIHAENLFSLWEYYPLNTVIELNENIHFELIPNSHVIGACQLLLYIKDSKHNFHKILYTSDLGNKNSLDCYVQPTQYIKKAEYVIAESTYGDRAENFTQKIHSQEIEELKLICKNTKGSVLIPTFSFGRAQLIMTLLYKFFKDDNSFNKKVIIDSVLLNDINSCYSKILHNESKILWESVLQWDKFITVNTYEESIKYQDSDEPNIILSSSGFLNGGRALGYLPNILTNKNSILIFVGYTPTESLAGTLQNNITHIMINHIDYEIKCHIRSFKTFSGHIQLEEMLEYYSFIQCKKIFLVHGSNSAKINLKKQLLKECSNKNKILSIQIPCQFTSFEL